MRLVLQAAFFLILLPLLHVSSEDDSACLQQFKDSVTDSSNYLYNWNFANASKGSVCSFVGVTCWKAHENRVLTLKLSQASLSGQFPSGLGLCTSLTGLDLSNNAFSGPIPADICGQMQYLTTLDLSQNSFAGAIPDNLARCQYLHSLHLQQNQLTGVPPWGIGLLPRLTDLDLSSNSLTGAIPSSYTNRSALNQSPFPASSFQNNSGLCGPPLTSPCRSSGPDAGVIVGAALAVVTFYAAGCALYVCGFCSAARKRVRKVGDQASG